MLQSNVQLFNAQAVITSSTSSAIDTSHTLMIAATAALTDSSPSNKTFVSGVREVDTFTFASKAGSGDGDYVVQNDTSGLAWAVALDTTGGAANTPTGAAWAAIPSGRKVYYDISGATSAADVATLAKTAFNALTGFTAVVTASDAGADGTLVDTAVIPGLVTAPAVHNKNDSGAGSVTVVRTTTGTATKVDPTNDQVTVTAHGYVSGLKVRLTTSSSVPAGLATGTDYYLIVVDANTLAFATSAANALAGTKIDITGYGVGTQTVAVQALAGTIKLQSAVEEFQGPLNPIVSAVWVDVPNSSQAFTSSTTSLQWPLAADTNWFSYANFGYAQLRAVATVTGGYLTVSMRLNGKGA